VPAGLITSVVPGGLAERVGLQPGDELLSINGHRLWDLIDVPFYGAEERLALQVRRSGREFTIGAERRYDEPLGMEFAIHATDLDMRRRVLHNPVAPDVMAQLRRLAALGIEVHAQIVVIPGLDDGPHLDRSIGDLTGLYPALRSVSVVPMGLTRYHQGGCRIHTKAEMRVVLEQVTGWQARLLPQLGIRVCPGAALSRRRSSR
jgi:NifB/MoaA-like Fe-S oxidoreductase